MKKKLLFILTVFTIAAQGQNKIESAIEETYNGTSWENSQGSNYIYDTNDNLTLRTSYGWNGSGWDQSFQESYTYNVNNKVTEQIGKLWSGGQFINVYRNVNTYNSDGLLIEGLFQEWIAGQWINANRSELTYSNMRPTQAISYDWNGSQWVNEDRSTVTYTGNNPTQLFTEVWDLTEWVTDSRDFYTYNANNQLVAYVEQTWDGFDWTEDYGTTYEFDANGNRTREIDSYFEDIESKTEYTYDLSAQLSNFVHPFKDKTGIDYLFGDFPYVNKIICEVYFDYDSSTSTYLNNYRTTYNYNSPLVLSVADLELSSIKLYPNPATDFIEVSGLTSPEKMTIYSVLGVKVLERIVSSNERIEVQNLSNGLYFLKFENGNTMKFLKK